MTEKNNRDLFAELAFSYVPHVLTLVDRNRYSPTYGCFDREYWHYRTLDFPCGMSQEHVLALAMLYRWEMPGNRWFGLERMRELTVAGIRFAMKGSHGDGTCDDYFPWERAMGALAFSTYAAAEAYRMLELAEDELAAFFRKRGDYLLGHNETGRLSNHQALSALALYTIYEICGDERYRRGAQERVGLALSWQHPSEGWFREYEGADAGYQTCTIDFLAKYHRKSGDESVVGPLVKAVEFCELFMHPDGSYGGEYGSRNTYHYYPHGFELMAAHTPLARRLNDRYLAGAAAGKRYYNDDSRMIGHLVHNWLAAWRDYAKREMSEPEVGGNEGIVWLADAGLAVGRRGGYHAVAGMKKGGVVKIYDRERCIHSDTGLIGRLGDGTVLVSHLQDAENQVSAEVEHGVFKVKGVFSKRKSKLASPVKLIVFRVLNMTLGRFFPNLLRGLLQKILITGKARTEWWFERTITMGKAGVTIEDRVDPGAGWVALSSGSDATSIYVAASNVYQESVVGCHWQDAPEAVLRGEVWRREIEVKD